MIHWINHFIFIFTVVLISPVARAGDSTLLPIAFYTPETSVAVGVISIHTLWPVAEGKNSFIQSYVAATALQQWMVSMTPRFYLNKGEQEIVAALNVSHFPSQYYGDAFTHLSAPEKMSEDSIQLSLSGAHNFYSHYFGRVLASFRQLRTLETLSGGALEHKLSTEGFRDLEAPSLGIGIDWDTRSNPQSPRSGLFLRLQTQITWIRDLKSEEIRQFQNNEAEARFYLPASESLTTAHQFFVGGLSDANLPHSFLLSIGGRMRLRGYKQGQYASRYLVMNQNEIRGLIKDRWGWAGFASFAKLGVDSNELQRSDLRLGAGGGINYLIDPTNNIKLKLDIALSPEEHGVYFVVGESF